VTPGLGGVLPALPLATREIAASSVVAAHLPIRLAKRSADGPLTISATLVRPDGTARQIDVSAAHGAEYAEGPGRVYRVALESPLAPGEYRLTIDVSTGKRRAVRELAFRVTAAP
jgi:hypothetical protein